MDSTPFKSRITKEKLVELMPWRQLLVIAAVLVLVVWLNYTPEGLLGKADAVGYAVCHRIDTRSFHLGDRQVPLCARCTGQYLGAMLSLFFLFLFRPRRTERPNWIIIGLFVAFFLAYAIDGLNSYLHLLPNLSRFYLYEPNNLLRLITGTGMGMGLGVMLFPALNQTLWKSRSPRPVLEGVRDVVPLMLLAVGLVAMVWTENTYILYPLALISAGGVLVLLTMVYTMAVMMVFKIENRYDKISQMVYPVLAGFFIALTQIALMDFVRYWLTGTWEGFHFG